MDQLCSTNSTISIPNALSQCFTQPQCKASIQVALGKALGQMFVEWMPKVHCPITPTDLLKL